MIVTETTCTVSVESKIRKEITAEFQGILITERFQYDFSRHKAIEWTVYTPAMLYTMNVRLCVSLFY